MLIKKSKKFTLTNKELKTIAAEVWDKAYNTGWQDYEDCYYKDIRDPERPETLTPNPYKDTK